MVVTAFFALKTQGPLNPMPERATPFAGLGPLGPVTAFSLVLHHSVPQIAATARVRQPFHQNLIFRAAFLFAALIYALFAAPVALVFGERTAAAANLGWATFYLSGSLQGDTF